MATHSYQHSAGNGLLASVSSSAIMDAVEIISIAAFVFSIFLPILRLTPTAGTSSCLFLKGFHSV